MKKIRTVIIEDEKPAARKLERQLLEFDDLELIATINSVEQGKKFFKEDASVDLVFSDIVLGDGLSFEIFEEREFRGFIIFTTAFDNYTLRAFKVNSIDYLLKPVSLDELALAIEKFRQFNPKEQFYSDLNLKELIHKPKVSIARVLTKIGYNIKVLMIQEVSYFYSANKITYAQCIDRSYPIDFTLEYLHENLDPADFFRVNRQYIINLKHIKNIHTSPNYKVEMEFQTTDEITVSRERVTDFKSWLVKS